MRLRPLAPRLERARRPRRLTERPRLQSAAERSSWVSSARHPYLAYRQRDPKSQSAAGASSKARGDGGSNAFRPPPLLIQATHDFTRQAYSRCKELVGEEMASASGQDPAPAHPTPKWEGERVAEQSSPTLHAHKSIVDRGRLVEPAAHVAIRRLATRAFHWAQPSTATSKAALAESRATRASLYQNTCSPSAISASGDSRMISERAFFAPRISTSD